MYTRTLSKDFRDLTSNHTVLPKKRGLRRVRVGCRDTKNAARQKKTQTGQKKKTFGTKQKMTKGTKKHGSESAGWKERGRLRPTSTSASFWMLNFWTTKGGAKKGGGPNLEKAGS